MRLRKHAKLPTMITDPPMGRAGGVSPLLQQQQGAHAPPRRFRKLFLTGFLMALRWTLWADWKDLFPEAVRQHLDGPAGYAVLAVVGLVALLLVLFLVTTLWRAI